MLKTGSKLRVAVLGGALVVALLLTPRASLAQTTILLPPSGGDDTSALAAAFDAAVAGGPGGTVELLPGTYRVSEPILIRSFSGTWRGAGINETVIQIEGASGAPFPLTGFGPLDPAFPGDPAYAGRPSVFVFTEVQGGAPTDLTVADLSFQIRGEGESWQQGGLPFPWNTISSLINVQRKRGGAGPPDRTIANLQVDRVEVVGELISNPPFFPVIENLFNFVSASGTLGDTELEMTLRITRSRFELCDRMVIVAGLVDSEITIGGLPPNANLFEAGTNAFNFINLQNSHVEVAHNMVDTHVFAFVQHAAPLADADYHFHHNAVDTAFYTSFWPPAALWILDFAVFSGGRSANVVIEHNDFDFADGTPFGLEDGPGFFYDPLNTLIEGLISDGVVVRQNRISGPFDDAAIAFGVEHLPIHPAWANPRASVVGNNVQQVEAGTAAIRLGPGSSDITVKGNPNEVLDEGTNNNVSGE